MAIPDSVGKLGPGSLTIGATGTPIDVSCLLNNASITSEKDESDSTTKLCGDTRAGSVTYSYTLAGNVDTDVGDAAGLFALSQSAPGSEQDFIFEPSSDLGTTATGKLVIDPLDFGADEMGADLTSDFEFTIIGKPTYAYGGVAADESSSETETESAA